MEGKLAVYSVVLMAVLMDVEVAEVRDVLLVELMAYAGVAWMVEMWVALKVSLKEIILAVCLAGWSGGNKAVEMVAKKDTSKVVV